MTQTTSHIPEAPPSAYERLAIDKQTLALDALSQLTWQFAKQPDFHHLIDILLLTISGQFTVAHAFASVQDPRSSMDKSYFIGTGRLKANDTLSTIGKPQKHVEYFLAHPGPCRVEDMNRSGIGAELADTLGDRQIILIAPLIYGNRLIGIAGLGEKVTNTPFEDSDIDLLGTLANTVTPFIANSFLFLEIAHLNAWYLEILNSVRQGVYVFGPDNRLKQMNTEGQAILANILPYNIENRSVLGCSIESVFENSAFPGWPRRLLKARTSDRTASAHSLVAKGADTERIYNVRASVMCQDDDADLDLIITLDDVTAQKESEQRLFDLEKFADKGVMASSIAHDLNNFLALIMGGTELAQMNLKRGKIEKVESSLEKLKSNAGKMERFTAGLMDYTRLNTSKAPNDLNTVITDVLSFMTSQKKMQRIAINSDLSPQLPPFEMDSDQIAQLLLNLLNNAADAIAEADHDEGIITVSTNGNGTNVRLSIADNGIGIVPETREKMFRHHFTTKKSGHGYGLVTCGTIIRNHGVEFGIESERNVGTTFTFDFPTSFSESEEDKVE